MLASLGGTAWAQSATWVTTSASGTSFNLNTNWTGSPTYGTTGTFTFMGGTSAAMPVLVQSTTIARLVTGTTAGATATGTITLGVAGSSMLTLSGTGTGSAGAISTSANTALSISAGVVLGGGNQTFYTTNSAPIRFDGVVSGGSANNTLTLTTNGAGSSSAPRAIWLNAANSFASVPVLNNAWIVAPSLGSTGGVNSPLGVSDTIRFTTAATLIVGANVTDATKAVTAGAATSSKNFQVSATGGLGGSNGITNIGFVQSVLSGTVSNFPGSNGFFVLNGSGTMSGLMTQASGTLGLFAGINASAGALIITNTNNDFTGRPTIIRGTTLTVPMLGMSGSPSPLGRSGTISVNNGSTQDGGGTLVFAGVAETSDKTFSLDFTIDGSGLGFVLDSGSGTLVLTNTAAWATTLAGNKSLRLHGNGAGTLAAALANTTSGTGGTNSLFKAGAGSWALTGVSTYTGSTTIQAGTLVFAKKSSLYNGGTSAWTKANILTGSGAAATLGVGVGGNDGLTTVDVTTLITNLSGDVGTGGMRTTSSWGFDTTNSGSTFTVADVIANTSGTGGGAIGVTKLGSGTLALTGTNTFTRGVRIEGGVLTIGNTSALGSGTGYLQFNGGALDLGGFTVARNGGMTATAGGLTNGLISGTGGLTKTGTGTFTISAMGNSFTGATNIQEGVVEVATVANSGQNSSLGAATTNATIGLGNAATSGTLRYVGSGTAATSRQLSLVGTTGGGAIDAGGGDALSITGTVVSSNTTAKVFTLTGTSTAPNSIGFISGTNLSVVKDGPGTWRFTGAASSFNGGFTAKAGTTIVPAGVGDNVSSPLGSGAITVGNAAAGVSGTASLFMADSTIGRSITVAAAGAGATQRVLLGIAATATSGSFTGSLDLGRDVTLVAPAGGTARFSGDWNDGTGSPSATRNVRIGTADSTGTVVLAGGGKTTSGTVSVEFGRLQTSSGAILSAGLVQIAGSTAELNYNSATPLASPLSFTAGTLSGTGTINTAVTAGNGTRLSPGNSPGTQAFNQGLTLLAGGTYAWEIDDATGTVGTDWDLVDVTGGILDLAGLSSGSKYNLDLITLSGTAGGAMANYTDGTAYTWQIFRTLSSGVVTSGGTAAAGTDLTSLFNVSTTNWVNTPKPTTIQVKVSSGGTGLDLVIVPEPTTLALAGVGIAAAGLAAWRRRARRIGE